jgi:hypothetical protein
MPTDIPPITYIRLEVEVQGKIASVELEPSADQQPLTDEGREVNLGTVVFDLQ